MQVTPEAKINAKYAHSGGRVFGLDVLRFLAISLVVFGHGVQLVPGVPALARFSRVFDYLGVEFFFVLSGFLIGKIFIEQFDKDSSLPTLLKFLKRRWWRTLPNYYLFLSINLIGFYLLKENFTFNWHYIFFLQNLISIDMNFFSVSWSLSVEEWFYFTIPFIYLLLYKIFNKSGFALFCVAIIVVVFSFAARIAYILNGDVTWNDEIRRIVILRMDSLIYGVIVSWVWLKKKHYIVKYKKIAIFLGLLFLIISIFIRNYHLINQTPWMLIFLLPFASIGTAFILPAFALWDVKNPTSLLPKFIISTSIFSYSLYLLHVPIIDFIIIMFGNLFKNKILYQILIFIFWIVSSYIGSFVIYRYFEKPFTSIRDKF